MQDAPASALAGLPARARNGAGAPCTAAGATVAQGAGKSHCTRRAIKRLREDNADVVDGAAQHAQRAAAMPDSGAEDDDGVQNMVDLMSESDSLNP